jgi:hypothetical protein
MPATLNETNLKTTGAMIIYNVTLKVDAAATEEWVLWMKGEHMPEVLATGLFTECKLCRLLEQDEVEGVTFVVQYLCQSIKEYNDYIDNHALTMREKSNKAFGGKFVAFRTVMEVL